MNTLRRNQKTSTTRTAPILRSSRRRFLASACFGAASVMAPSLGWLRVHAAADPAKPARAGKWIQLFNGRNLDGWTPKIRGFDLGDNHANTFRVEDGLLKVAYDRYATFDGKFGHIFYREKFSDYVVRVEYRFVGQHVPGGPSWAVRNSGIMLHCQAPETMEKNQDFPVSIEVQLLGGDGSNPRSTANLCTPGTNVMMGGKLIMQHCTNSRSKTYHGDQWVTVEVEVRGHSRIKHIVEGATVLEYTEPQLDERDPDAQRLLARGAAKMLREGYLSLQSESHAVEFRKVELLRLSRTADSSATP